MNDANEELTTGQKFNLWVAVLALLLMLAVLSGCSTISPKVAANVARSVNHYCAEPIETRRIFRVAVDDLTFPHTVRVHCAGDFVEDVIYPPSLPTEESAPK